MSAFGDAFATTLEQGRAFARYRSCVQAALDGCDDLWTTAVFRTIALREISAQAWELGLELVSQHGMDGVQAVIETQLRSDDPLQRIATLTLLRRHPSFHVVRLPREAYEKLRDRPLPEAQMILQHWDEPLPDAEIASQVLQLGLDPDVPARVRRAVPHAFGHAQDAALLGELVESWLAPGNEGLMSSSLELRTALARCGDSCEHLIERIANDSRPEIRALLVGDPTVDDEEEDDET